MALDTTTITTMRTKLSDYKVSFNSWRTKLTASDTWQGNVSTHMFEESDKIINLIEKTDSQLQVLLMAVQLSNQYDIAEENYEEQIKLLAQNELARQEAESIEDDEIRQIQLNDIKNERVALLAQKKKYEEEMQSIVTKERQLGISVK